MHLMLETTIHAQRLLAARHEDDDSWSGAEELTVAGVCAVLLVPLFWSINRKARQGRIPRLADRTTHVSRTRAVVLSALNIGTTVLFLVGGVSFLLHGDVAEGVSLLVMAALVGAMVFVLLRQGSNLRRDGQPDRAPNVAQRTLSTPRRTAAQVAGVLAGIGIIGVIQLAFDHQPVAAVPLGVLAVIAWAVSFVLLRPARIAQKREEAERAAQHGAATGPGTSPS